MCWKKFKCNNKLKKIQFSKVLDGWLLKGFGTEGLGFVIYNVGMKLVKENIKCAGFYVQNLLSSSAPLQEIGSQPCSLFYW